MKNMKKEEREKGIEKRCKACLVRIDDEYELCVDCEDKIGDNGRDVK